MKKHIKAIVPLIVFTFFMTSSLVAETVAVVLKVQGTIQLYRSGKVSDQSVKRGFRLQDGDKLVTGPKAFAAVRFTDDASLLRIRANSTCTIKNKRENNELIKNVYVEVGTIFARVTKQRTKFEISTPTSVASVKGTEWIVEQILDGMTLWYGKVGLVDISNDAGAALLRPGETVEVLDANTAPVARKSKPGEGEWDDLGVGTEDYEFEFENDQGERKILRFQIKLEE
jgi:hypothetical protein